MFFTPLFKMIPSLFKKQKIWIFKNLEIMILDINKISIKRLEIEKPVINNLIFKKPDFIKLSVTDDPVTPVNLEQLRPSLLERLDYDFANHDDIERQKFWMRKSDPRASGKETYEWDGEEWKCMDGYYDCPVYYVSQRGGGNPPGSYVFFGQLKTSEPTVNTLYGVYQYKWVLAGVGMLLQIE